MSQPRCWLCGRPMKLYKHEHGYRLWCGPCAATYMDTKGRSREEFITCYEKDHGSGQLSIFEVEVDA